MNGDRRKPPLELWAGIECTVNRVGDRYFDQLERTGHADRIDDIDRFAELGIKTLRYPLLWERIAPTSLAAADWTWPDQRLARLRHRGIRPIAGLLHHGSGPRHTSLLDPEFPDQLAAYAGAVARRYPWLDAYTPVNEPLTTARFCGLYGHWYPHRRDDAGFVRALLGQCRGIAQAMAAIRAVNPAATLVQTEDLGYVHAAPALAYQAEFENQRRWLSFDLLCGRVDRGHPLYEWLRGAGAEAGELRWFHDHPVPPDVFGLNYYVTSERFLDDDLAAWPSSTHGGNHRERYADVAAIHAVPVRGVTELLTQVWERYRRPVAITEAHLGCTREEQLRWLVELWQGADAARAAGVPVSAVTVWALLGSFDWHCLVTRDEGRYESGVFDLRGPTPRPTALATVVRALAAGQPAEHPVLGEPGWWRREAPIRTRASEAA